MVKIILLIGLVLLVCIGLPYMLHSFTSKKSKEVRELEKEAKDLMRGFKD